MGGSNSKVEKFNKHVVIVGGSFAGLTIAEFLWNHFEVTVIDKNDYFEFFVTNMKCLVDDNDFADTVVPFSEIVSGNKNKFKFM